MISSFKLGSFAALCLFAVGCSKPVSRIDIVNVQSTPDGHLTMYIHSADADSGWVKSSGTGRYSLQYGDWTKDDRAKLAKYELDGLEVCSTEVKWTEADYEAGSDSAKVQADIKCPAPTATTLIADRFDILTPPAKHELKSMRAHTGGAPEALLGAGRRVTAGIPRDPGEDTAALARFGARFARFAPKLTALPPAAQLVSVASPPCELGPVEQQGGYGVFLASLETWRWLAAAPTAPAAELPKQLGDSDAVRAAVTALSGGRASDLKEAQRVLTHQGAVIAVIGVANEAVPVTAGIKTYKGGTGNGVVWLVSANSNAPACYKAWSADVGDALKLKQETHTRVGDTPYARYVGVRQRVLTETLASFLPWKNAADLPVLGN